MTTQYIVGELSLLLARLQTVASGQASAGTFAQLRHEVERRPFAELSFLVWCALKVTDTLCEESLERGDAAAFIRQASAGCELREFAVCAGLLDTLCGD